MEHQIQNYIGGDWHAAQSGAYLDNYQPATGKVYSYLPDSDARDVELAVEAARKAFPHWSKCGAQERFQILMRVADLIERDIESFASAESADSGKARTLAQTVDIPRAISNFRFFATAILHFSSEAHPMEGEAVNILKVKPKTTADCTDCKHCVEICPMESILREDPTQVVGICIKCGACIKGCPVKAKYYDDPGFLGHKLQIETNFKDPKDPEWYL